MRRLVALPIISIAMCAPAIAGSGWYAGEDERCAKSDSAEMVGCTFAILDEWDVRLNLAYHSLDTSLSGEAREAFHTAQRKWISYRDANCEWYRTRAGAVAEVEGAACMLGMTRERVLEMEDWLER